VKFIFFVKVPNLKIKTYLKSEKMYFLVNKNKQKIILRIIVFELFFC